MAVGCDDGVDGGIFDPGEHFDDVVVGCLLFGGVDDFEVFAFVAAGKREGACEVAIEDDGGGGVKVVKEPVDDVISLFFERVDDVVEKKEEVVAVDYVVQVDSATASSRAVTILSNAFRLWEMRFFVSSSSSAKVLL